MPDAAKALARMALRHSDVDDPCDVAADRLAIITSEVSHRISRVKRRGHARAAAWEFRATRAEQRVQRGQLRHTRKVARSNDEREQIDAWCALGLRDRLSIHPLSPPTHFALLLGLLSLDFYIFAQAAALVTATSTSFANIKFILGGCFGSVVFLCGWLLAVLARKYGSVAHAQEKLMRERASEDFPVQRAAATAVTLLVLLIFLCLCALGLGLRLEAYDGSDSTQSLSLIGFQVAIPIFAALAEFVVRDPTVVSEPRRGPLLAVSARFAAWMHAREQSWRRRTEAAIDDLRTTRETAMRFLAVELEDRGFEVSIPAPDDSDTTTTER
jgi:hypothetical protein